MPTQDQVRVRTRQDSQLQLRIVMWQGALKGPLAAPQDLDQAPGIVPGRAAPEAPRSVLVDTRSRLALGRPGGASGW